jgi:hypothetical protein
MSEPKKKSSGWLARWRERRREAGRRAAEVQARSQGARRANFDRGDGRGAGDGPVGPAGGI